MMESTEYPTFAPHPAARTFRDLTGERFGRLTVLGFKGRERGHSHWWCLCKCGTVTHTTYQQLRDGKTRSCGCLKRDYVQHQPGHRLTRTPEYYCWRNMLNRCYYEAGEKYSDYGGRGIKVCDRWRTSFLTFLADMGKRPSPRHQIDRIDNDGDYTPKKCRWVTPKQNAANRREKRRMPDRDPNTGQFRRDDIAVTYSLVRRSN